MPTAPRQLASSLTHLSPVAIIDILLVAFLIYQFLMIVRGRRAAHIMLGLAILMAAYFLSDLLGLELLRAILANLAPFAPFALIVMFQSEIRRILARIGRRRWFTLGSRLQKREVAEEVVLAMSRLSGDKMGALIVIEGDIGLRTFIESGVLLEAYLSRDLLLSIFLTNSALHDGAVIVQNDRVAAAACFLPLTVKPGLAAHLGTRHRAAIGVTEETDCLALVVSEETGRMSVAAGGEIELDVTEEQLTQRIAEHSGQRRSARKKRAPAKADRQLERATHDAHSD